MQNAVTYFYLNMLNVLDLQSIVNNYNEYVYSRQASMTDSLRTCYKLLTKTSRSFSVVIKALDKQLRYICVPPPHIILILIVSKMPNFFIIHD